jgi:RNA polymerase sigma-70 factor (ECF subfamily)
MNARARQEADFAACYAAHHSRIYHLCLRYGSGDHGFAEDVTHDAFVKLLQHLPRLREHEDLGGWLYRVATNLALSQLRRRRWLRAWFEHRDPPRLVAEDPTPDLAAEQREAAERALQTLDTLPPRERIVVCMKLLDGKSQTEIAEALSLSEGYVSKLLARGRDRIRAAGWDVEADEPA